MVTEEVLAEQNNSGESVFSRPPSDIPTYSWLWRTFLHFFSFLGVLIFRLSKIQNQCHITLPCPCTVQY